MSIKVCVKNLEKCRVPLLLYSIVLTGLGARPLSTDITRGSYFMLTGLRI